ncbi:hypothetical protein EV424DRAFT_1471504 [Suillus variegatus]|nr:hypothetical protein EV424DRAFT_1471504 [Suillus variegatus]
MHTFTRLCPNCSREFPSIEVVVLHLNSQSTCWSHKARPQQLPVPPGLRGSPSNTTGHCHPRSGYIFGIGKNLYDRLQDDQYNYWREINTYYPFHDEGEWELASFLIQNLNQTQIDKFLKLKWLGDSKHYSTNWMDALPCLAEWKVSKLEFTGYKTVHPIQLIWRDALEVIKQLFSDPVFTNNITFQPHVVHVGNQCKYGDYMSADLAWKIQDCLPLGATQVPIILGSDKTPVTRTTGGLEMHPIFITIGNLDSEVHSKATLRAWRCITYMPVAKFPVHPDYQTILQAWLWHKFICYVYTPLVAHVCDLPEACMIAAVSKSASPLTMVSQENFGDGNAAKAVHLSGVHMPYWRDWNYACPSVFLAGEILHTCIKFFADHLLNWIKEVVGKFKLDARYINQHKRMTGRGHRDIQCTIVASIAGVAPPNFIRAIHALVDFIYLAQNPIHSAETLSSMMQSLSDFHTFKHAVIEAQAWRGKKGVKEDFFIPKLELLQSFRGTVERLGTLMQFSADMTERLLITHCKDLFSVQILNRQESIELFNLYSLFCSHHASLVNVICTEDEAVTTVNPALSWVSRVLPDESHSVHGPRPVRNHFLKGILSGDALTAFHLTSTPDFKSLSPTDIHTIYSLIDFDHALSQFIKHFSLSTGKHTRWDHKYGHFHTWKNFRLQLHSVFWPRLIMPSSVIQAYPPDSRFPLGNCDNVLVDVTGNDGQIISRIAQVRLIFQPTLPRASDLVLPSYLSHPLLYIQYYDFVATEKSTLVASAMWGMLLLLEEKEQKTPELTMWTVERSYVEDQHGKHRCGGVVPLTSVDEKISSAICLENKESYHTLSTEFA